MSSKKSEEKKSDEKKDDKKEKTVKKVTMKDFDTIKLIGRGSYGEVRVCRKKDDKKLYAIKMMKKRKGLQKRHIQRILAERDVMAFGANHWIVQLHWSFQDEKNLYLVMEYMPGGDLMGILIRHDLLSEVQTQFYVAEMALAINSVHKMGYCHRDLKPDNVLLDKEGHIKLTDFGLAKGLSGRGSVTEKNESGKKLGPTEKKKAWRANRCFSMVGTPDYMAPEVCTRQGGYKQNCDWWSLGVIMYECMCGYPPFYAGDSGTTIDKVKNWEKEFGFPDEPGGLTKIKISDTSKDLIKKLITSADKRILFEDIKKHKFFNGIDWEKIRQGKAIIVPTLKKETDFQNFDEFGSQPSEDQDDQQQSKGKDGGSDVQSIIGYTFQKVKVTKMEEDPFAQGVDISDDSDSSEDSS